MTRQVRTSGTTTQAIMRRTGFVAGVEDVRSGRAPNYLEKVADFLSAVAEFINGEETAGEYAAAEAL
jgi:hypothetical protein